VIYSEPTASFYTRPEVVAARTVEYKSAGNGRRCMRSFVERELNSCRHMSRPVIDSTNALMTARAVVARPLSCWSFESVSAAAHLRLRPMTHDSETIVIAGDRTAINFRTYSCGRSPKQVSTVSKKSIYIAHRRETLKSAGCIIAACKVIRPS